MNEMSGIMSMGTEAYHEKGRDIIVAKGLENKMNMTLPDS